MRNPVLTIMFVGLLALTSRSVSAQTAACNALGGAQKSVAVEVLNEEHPYDCCDETISACLQKGQVCKLAKRLANQVCRMAAAGKTKAEIKRALAQRATSMQSATKVPIDLNKAEAAGDAAAKVKVVAYVCPRCPYCAKLMPYLHQAVTAGALKGKAKAYLREFPIRSHANSTEGGLAMVAARTLGHGWAFALHLYSVFDQYDPNKLPELAKSKGMDEARFRELMADPGVRRELLASKKEGVRNKVDATPSLFINGRKYTGELDLETVVDVIEEEHDQMTGSKY